MYRGLLISSGFHVAIVMVSILALPFVAKKPLDIPPLISVELIQIAEKTNIPFAPKASKIIEKAKKENEKLLSEQAPPKKVKKDEKKEVIQSEIKKVKDEWNKEWNILLNSNMNPINPYRIVNEINKNID